VGRSGVCTLLVLAVAVSACGKSPAPPPPKPRLTQAAFVQKARVICRSFSRRTKPLVARMRKSGKRPDLEALALELGEVRRPLRMFVFQLSRLRPPVRQERRFRELIHVLNQELAYLNGAYLALSTYDAPALKASLRRMQRKGRLLDALSKHLGLGRCGD
jgi:hypothetical protein